MTHLTEEQLVDGYYVGFQSEFQCHLDTCHDCQLQFLTICQALAAASEAGLPPRGAHYGAEVWARVSVQLPALQKRTPWRLLLSFATGVAILGLAILSVVLDIDRSSKSTAAKPKLTLIKLASHDSTIVVKFHLKTTDSHADPKPVHHLVHPSKVAVAALPPATSSDADLDLKLLALNGLLASDAKPALSEILGIVQGDSSERIKEHALFVLAQSDSSEAHHAFMEVVRGTSNPSLQVKAVRILGLLGNAGERKELAGLYRSSSDQAVKLEILNGLMLSGSKKALQRVANTEADPGLRNSAFADLSITALPNEYTGATAEKKQVLNSVLLAADSKVLLDMLKRQDVGSRVATVRSLAVIGEQTAILTNLYRTENDPDVQRAVLDALVIQKNSEALMELAREETDNAKKAEILQHLSIIKAQVTFK